METKKVATSHANNLPTGATPEFVQCVIDNFRPLNLDAFPFDDLDDDDDGSDLYFDQS